VSYKWKYCDAKSESGNFLLKNVVVIVIIINVIVFSCPTATSDASDRLCLHERKRERERERERESERAKERAKEQERKRIVYVPSAEFVYGQWRERCDVYIMCYILLKRDINR